MKLPSGRLFVLLALLFAAQTALAAPAASPTPADDPHLKTIIDCIALVISLLALCVSGFVAWRSYIFNNQSTRRTARETHMKMLFDVGQSFVTSPTLWMLYDTHGSTEGRDTPEEISKRRAFFYQHLNMFDLVWDFYENVIKKRNRVDKGYWDSWKRYMKQFFRDSSEARSLFYDPRTREIYSEDFVEFIEEKIIKGVS
jgi:hypothetical protein